MGHKPRALMATSGHSQALNPRSGSTNIAPGKPVSIPPTFQAGHEGPIPFARSNQKPQLIGMIHTRSPEPGSLSRRLRDINVPLAPRTSTVVAPSLSVHMGVEGADVGPSAPRISCR
jgi:hypothetical protein